MYPGESNLLTNGHILYRLVTSNSPDLLTLARQQGANYFVDLMWATGLAEDLVASADHHTLIIPTDRVIKELSQELKDKMRNTCFLREILRHHIVKGTNRLNGSSTNRILMTMQKTPVIYNSFCLLYTSPSPRDS